jgi:hypothetical protein
MTSVTVNVKNLGPGIRIFHRMDGKSIAVAAGDSRTIDMHIHHVGLFAREAAKQNPLLELTMDAETKKEVETHLARARKKFHVPNVPAQTLYITDPALPAPIRGRQPRRPANPAPAVRQPPSQTYQEKRAPAVDQRTPPRGLTGPTHAPVQPAVKPKAPAKGKTSKLSRERL